MKMEKHLKSFILILLSLICVCFSACVNGERDEVRAGRSIMEEYLSVSHKGARVTEINAHVLRPAADTLALSGFVKGKFESGGEKYDFAVNTVTGDVYTSERLPEFEERVYLLICERLGIDPDECVYSSLCSLHADSYYVDPETGDTHQAYLGEVIPVTADVDELARGALSDPLHSVIIRIACPQKYLTAEAISSYSAEGWEGTSVRLFGYEGAIPDKETFEMTTLSDFDGDTVRIEPGSVKFTGRK